MTTVMPMIESEEQKELLVQTLGGIRSVIRAEPIIGHTMESRSTLRIQLL